MNHMMLVAAVSATLLGAGTSHSLQVHVERCSGVVDGTCRPVERVSGDDAIQPATRFRIVVTPPAVDLEQPYFVLTSVDVLAAPRHLGAERGLSRLKQEVAWGYLANRDNMFATVVDLGPSTGAFEVEDLPVAAMLHNFSEPDDGLWLWSVRTTVRIVGRDGVVLDSASVDLDLAPLTQGEK